MFECSLVIFEEAISYARNYCKHYDKDYDFHAHARAIVSLHWKPMNPLCITQLSIYVSVSRRCTHKKKMILVYVDASKKVSRHA